MSKFDIKQHEWSGMGFVSAECDGDCIIVEGDCFTHYQINKQDAIAMARHFKLTADDLEEG